MCKEWERRGYAPPSPPQLVARQLAAPSPQRRERVVSSLVDKSLPDTELVELSGHQLPPLPELVEQVEPELVELSDHQTRAVNKLFSVGTAVSAKDPATGQFQEAKVLETKGTWTREYLCRFYRPPGSSAPTIWLIGTDVRRLDSIPIRFRDDSKVARSSVPRSASSVQRPAFSRSRPVHIDLSDVPDEIDLSAEADAPGNMRPRPAEGDQRKPHRGAKYQRLSLAGAAAAKHSVAVSVGQDASARRQGFESAAHCRSLQVSQCSKSVDCARPASSKTGKHTGVCGVRLSVANPRLAADWHLTKNGKLKPFDVSASSNEKAWWAGSCGHEWQATIFSRHRGSGCYRCNHRSPYDTVL